MNTDLFNVKIVGQNMNTNFRNIVPKRQNPLTQQKKLTQCIGLKNIRINQ